jgi:RHS repeat-associated protein
MSTAWTASSAQIFAAIAMQRPDGTLIGFSCANGTCTPNSDVAIRVSASASGFTLVDERDNTETYTTAGALTSITYVDGYQQTLNYNVDGTLSTISDNHGRVLQLSYTNGLQTGLTLPDGTAITYQYDTYGRLLTVTYPSIATPRTYQYAKPLWPNALTGIIDENNQTYASIGYDSQGRATSTALGGGISESHSLVYNSDGSATVTDPLGAVRTYSYQTLQGRPKNTAITGQPCDRCGPAATSYDSAGYIASKTDFNGNITVYNNDPSRGLETRRVEGSGAAQRIVNTIWNANFRVPIQRTVLNASSVTESMSKWTYNSRGQMVSRCEMDPAIRTAFNYACGSLNTPPTGVRQWIYGYADTPSAGYPLVGLLQSVDGPRTDVSDVTTYSYYQTTDLSGCANLGKTCHNLGDLQKVTNALGQTTTYWTYDKNGRVTRIQDANGTFTDLTYHARGWLLTRTVRANADGSANASLDATTTFAYDNVGNVTKVTQPDGAYLSYTYDAAHRLTDIADNLNNRIHYTLDGAGNRTQEDTKDPSNTIKRTLSRQYDQLNHLVKLLNATSATVQWYQNPTEAPPHGVTYTDGYDGNGNAIYSVDGAQGAGTEQQYDPLNRLVKTLQDHAGTGSTHDTTTQYAYDTRNNLLSVIDPDNLTTSYNYDGLNNLSALYSPDTGSTGYTYDSAGNRLTQTDARGVTSTYAYDAVNRLTSISYPTTKTNNLNITYAYDQATAGCYNIGRLTTMTDSSGTTTYCYDRRGNVMGKTQVTNGITLVTGYTYTLADRLLTITYPSGHVITYGRDSVGRITSVGYKASAGAGMSYVLNNVTYYPFGPMNVLTFGNGRTLTKTYDQDYAIDKVVSSSASGLVIDATVDAIGNLTNASSAVAASPPTQQYRYDNLYRLTNVQDGSGTSLMAFAYDNTGDRLSKTPQGSGAQAYTYTSGTHHVASVAGVSRSYDANGNTTQVGTATQVYDNRNRLASTNAPVSFNYNGRGERVFKTGKLFTYDEAGRVLGEYTTAGAALGEYVYADSTPVAYMTAGSVYYVETDQLGTPRQVIRPGTTPATDTTLWKWDYFANNSAFGENTPSVQTVTFNLRFPGQYYDTETGLNYNYLRDYEPGTGRYVESDPIGLRGGSSTYSYVKNAPTSDFDLFGLFGFTSQCNRGQKKQIRDALDLVRIQWKECFGPDCQGNNLITRTAKETGWLDAVLSTMEFDCAKRNYVPHSNEEACGWTYGSYHTPIKTGGREPGQIVVSPAGFTDPAGCQCLSSTLFHELLHFADDMWGQTSNDQNHSIINPIEKRCAQCPLPTTIVTP